MANKKILNKKQGMHICNYYYIHKLVKEKNPTNIFYEETSLGRTTISTQNLRTFPRQNPQKSIFQDGKNFRIFPGLWDFLGRVETLFLVPKFPLRVLMKLA